MDDNATPTREVYHGAAPEACQPELDGTGAAYAPEVVDAEMFGDDFTGEDCIRAFQVLARRGKPLLLDNIKPVVNGNEIGRNSPCPCGSGRKYKKCCGARPT